MEKGGDRMNIELLRQFLDFYAVYLVTQLGRSVLCSFFLLPLFLALRITFLERVSLDDAFFASLYRENEIVL